MTLHQMPDTRVLNTADAFRATAQILNECSDSMGVPTVVNAAFALELYLKSLNIEWKFSNTKEIAQSGKKPYISRSPMQKGHLPSKLFEALKQPVRESLEERYKLSPYNGCDQSLKNAIEDFDGLFERWRYIFEGQCSYVNITSLFDMLAFLSESIHALPQKWA